MVFIIKIKSLLSILFSKTALFLCEKILKGGTNFPGKVALKLDKDILKVLSKDFKVVLITGTNGKTTTTSMIYNILKDSGKDVITNSSGANMLPGIISCFIKNFKFKRGQETSYAVIETDEANVKLITNYIEPEIITVTNLFRDQLDRFGEVYTTLDKIMEGIKLSPKTKLLLNGDEPLFGDLNCSNPKIFFGFAHDTGSNKIDINAEAKFCIKCQKDYSYNFITYNHLGDYFCSNCDYKRPSLDYSVDSIHTQTHEGTTFSINDSVVTVNQSGVYNIYNAICAYSTAAELGLSNDVIINSIESSKSSFGRQESIIVGNNTLKIFLVKNPAGYNEAINVLKLDDRSKSCAFLLNDNYADGRDVSWIWDVKFEELSSLTFDSIIAGGLRSYDMAVRLKTAGMGIDETCICGDFDILEKKITQTDSEIFYIFATYTAMTSFRKHLHTKGYIENLWK